LRIDRERVDHKLDQASPYHKFAKQARTSGVISVFEGSDNFRRDFVSVEHVVDIHQKFFNIKESGIWNIGTGKAKSFLEVAQEIAKDYGATYKFFSMPKSLQNNYQPYTCADLTKLRKTMT
jgi:ADP-L-glycero-D-manno-heptose 6-epimerase